MSSTQICRVCDATPQWEPMFSRTGFRGHTMRYIRCGSCGSLICEDPHWLNDAYASADDIHDGGAPARASAVAKLIQVLSPERGDWLDYGAGQGLLATRLVESGYRVVSHDPFRPTMERLPDVKFTGASLVEVLEHLVTPWLILHNIGSRLEGDAFLVLTTNLYHPEYGPDWHYLAAEFGQHITFPSPRGLARLATRGGFVWDCSVRPNDFPALEAHILRIGEADDNLEQRLVKSGFSMMKGPP